MNTGRTPNYRDVRPVRELVTEDQVADALHFIATVPSEIGAARAEAEYREHLPNVTRSLVTLYSDERAADKRRSEAEASPAYIKSLNEERLAKERYYVLQAKAKAAELTIEVWRTLQANQRR